MKNIYVRLLQFLIGTEVDGDFGPKSEAAADDLILRLESYRDAFTAVTIRDAFSAVTILKEGGKDGTNNTI